MNYPKDVAQRNPHLLAMARGEGCVLRVPGVCDNNRETTVSAHSNWMEHGKCKARKAHDQYTVYACARCHTWLDQSFSAGPREKREAFDAAHKWMVSIWRDIAYGVQPASPKDRAAAEWALERIAS